MRKATRGDYVENISTGERGVVVQRGQFVFPSGDNHGLASATGVRIKKDNGSLDVIMEGYINIIKAATDEQPKAPSPALPGFEK